MAISSSELSAKVQSNEGGKNAPLALQHRVNQWFSKSLPNLCSLAGNESEAKKIFAICLSQINRNPKLAECTPESLTSCISQTMSFKLLPGPFKECAFVPRRNKKGQWEANWQPQYQGLVKLAYNSGVLATIRAEVVWSNDIVNIRRGLVQDLEHIPHSGKREGRGTRVGVYCVWKTTLSKEPEFIYIDEEFVNTIKSRSPASKFPDSPWNSTSPDDVDWMWKKTALIQALKMIPKSDEMVNLLDAEENSEVERPKGVLNFSIETTAETVEPDAAE